MEKARLDDRDAPWPVRPWIMALLCAVAGVAFHQCVDRINSPDSSRFLVFSATFIAVTTLAFVLSVELRRWQWSVIFSVLWGTVIGGVAVATFNYYGRGEVAGLPFFSSIFSVLLAIPLFQVARDEGALRFDPLKMCHHVWGDAVIGSASLLFVGVSFLLAWLVASLFNLIGLSFLDELLREGWFGFGLAGLAFGGAVGLLRERDALVGTMLRLAVVILSVLAPILAAALTFFLASLPFTGLTGLWNGWLSAAALTMVAGAGAYVMLNAALGLDAPEEQRNRIFIWSARILAAVVLPLAALGFAALVLRVNQYGWTPERMWGVIAAVVALTFGVGGWWAMWRGRAGGFASAIRTAQTRVAVATCVLALVLSLQLLDFGAVSTRSQVARLGSGAVSAEQFDWAAMAYDFGPAGRAALRRISRTGSKEERASAKEALDSPNRYLIALPAPPRESDAALTARLHIIPANKPLPIEVRALVRNGPWPCSSGACTAVWVDDGLIALVGQGQAGYRITTNLVSRNANGHWQHGDGSPLAREEAQADLSTARVEVSTRQVRVVTVDGVAVGAIDDPLTTRP